MAGRDIEQSLAALAVANDIRQTAARERRALVGAPCEDIVAVFLDPPLALSRSRLSLLLGGNGVGLVPCLGPKKIGKILASLSRDPEVMRMHWHGGLRLAELNRHEREILITALVRASPARWSAGCKEISSKSSGHAPQSLPLSRDYRWLDGDKFTEWLEMKCAKPHAWKHGQRVSLRKADQVLTDAGLHINMVPEDIWAGPVTLTWVG